MGKRQERQARVDATIARTDETFAERELALKALEAAAENFDAESVEVAVAAVRFARTHRALMVAIRAYGEAWDEAYPRREKP